MKKQEKTNVMRILDQKKLVYRSHCYAHTDAVSGEDVAAVLGQDPGQVFKTLVTVGHSGQNYVFVIPVCQELDLKKAAQAAGEKCIEMVRSRDLLTLTGYVHGGCSPIGMKKSFPTFFDRSAARQESIFFSAGKIGYQVQLPLADLEKMIAFQLADLCN